MDNLYQNNNPAGAQAHRGEINGQQGTWVPVESESVQFPVSNDAANPSLGKDGNYYYAQGGQPNYNNNAVSANNNGNSFGPIAANQYNAIPTPSNIVQLPPIVQPIALVPFASQQQPLVQYDANYREEVPKTNLEPIYKEKPYAGLSVLCILLGVIGVVVMCLVACLEGGATALDTIFGLLILLGAEGITSSYHTDVLSKTFASGISQGFSTDFGAALTGLLVPIFYVIAIVCAVISIIYFLVKLGKGKSPRHFVVTTLLGLIFSLVNIILMIVASDMNFAIGAIIVALAFLLLLIVPFFARRGAQVIDYSASKRLYGDNRGVPGGNLMDVTR